MKRKCYAIKNNGKPCFANVTDAWPVQTCHIHNPNGKFRQQLKAKGMGKNYIVKCDHKWYMKNEGIQCKNCLAIWQKEDTNQ